MSLVKFHFAKNVFNGPFTDDSDHHVYNISAIKSGKKKGSTVVHRRDGVPIGEISWKRSGRSKKVTLHGRTAKSLLFQRKEHWYSRARQAFQDGATNTFVWNSKGSKCRTLDRVLVATFKPEKYQLIRKNERAALSVDPQYLSILDLIVFTALELERRRQHVEKVQKGFEALGVGAEALASAA